MEPTVIQGPAYVKRGALTAYVDESGVAVDYQRESWNPKSANHGALGARHKSTRIVVAGRPLEYETLASYWPYVPGDIGGSIFSATALAVIPKTGNKITFPRSGVSKMPGLKLSPLSIVWKAMEWTCLGDPTKEQNAADYRQVIAALAGGEGAANADFDQTKVISPRIAAVYGAAPFNALETEDGWDVDPVMEVKWMTAANFGVIEGILVSLGVEATANLINLTEAQYATLMKLQDATATLPGDPYASPTDARDLVLSATGITVTLKNMGVETAKLSYQAGGFRQGPVKFVNRRTFTAGVADALWTLA